MTLLPAPPVSVGTVLDSVVCPQPTTCVVTAEEPVKSGPPTTQLEVLDGTSWHPQAFPIPPSQLISFTFACPAVGDCEVNLNQRTPYLWDMAGQWTAQTFAPSHLPSSTVTGMACAGTADCYAMGFSMNASGLIDTPFLEHYDGTGWSLVTLARPSHGADLDGIACAAKTQMCMTVGFESHPNAQTAFSPSIAYRHTSSGWNLSHAPDTKGAMYGGLNTVACPSAHTCVAATTITNSADNAQAQADVWHAGRWRLTPLPGIPAKTLTHGDSGLGPVACMSDTACVALGSWDAGLGVHRSTGQLIEVWDGQAWRVRRGPLPVPAGGASGSVVPSDITCGSPTTCIIVGSYKTRAGKTRPYAVERVVTVG